MRNVSCKTTQRNRPAISHVASSISMKIAHRSTFYLRSLSRTRTSNHPTMKFSSLAVATVLLASSANGFTGASLKSFGVQVRQSMISQLQLYCMLRVVRKTRSSVEDTSMYLYMRSLPRLPRRLAWSALHSIHRLIYWFRWT
jgi:hypothetical protein